MASNAENVSIWWRHHALVMRHNYVNCLMSDKYFHLLTKRHISEIEQYYKAKLLFARMALTLLSKARLANTRTDKTMVDSIM